eukprot:6211990-Pleurochrysis_carterae.AAC.2
MLAQRHKLSQWTESASLRIRIAYRSSPEANVKSRLSRSGRARCKARLRAPVCVRGDTPMHAPVIGCMLQIHICASTETICAAQKCDV